jgi:hypothetical protein
MTFIDMPMSVSPKTNLVAQVYPGTAPFGPLPCFYSWDAPWNQNMVPMEYW